MAEKCGFKLVYGLGNILSILPSSLSFKFFFVKVQFSFQNEIKFFFSGLFLTAVLTFISPVVAKWNIWAFVVLRMETNTPW